MFKSFFDAGLGFPAVSLLEGVLCYFYVELPQLSANAIAHLTIFKLTMQAKGCEGRADLFTLIHEVNCQLKMHTKHGENFQLRPEYGDAFLAKAINNRWYTK